MKKNLLIAMLVGATVIGSSQIAIASEVQTQGNEVNVEAVADNKVSDEAMSELRYAIEEMKIALTRLDSEGITAENKEYITTFGATAVERVRGFYDELTADATTVGHVEFISTGWNEILTAVNEFESANKANKEAVSEEAMSELRYAIEEMKIALTRLDSEGITAENKEYITTFGATAVERVRGFYDELTADATTAGHVEFISTGWNEILTAVNEFESANKANKEAVSEEAMSELRYAIEEMKIALTRLDSEGITAENKEYITTFGATAIERVRGFYDELTADATTAGHVEFISTGWNEILTAVNEFESANKANKEAVSEEAMSELRYAIEEMKIALTRLDSEGITAENKEYITTFGATAVERVRAFYDELTADATTAGHVEFISAGWNEILAAIN